MARGESGRIVIEVEPEMKRRLYAALAISGSTLKDWFTKNAAIFCDESNQPSLFQNIGGNREFAQAFQSEKQTEKVVRNKKASKVT